MTSAQTMLKKRPERELSALGLGLGLALLAALVGCQTKPRIPMPGVLVSPYAAEAAFAVIPPRNETGASFVDPDAVGDKIVAALAQTRGLHCVPINRTIEAMRALDLPAVTTPTQARQLARVMGVDGIVAGTITAYDPYNPPVFGVSLALYAMPSLSGDTGGPLDDPRLLSMQASDSGYTGAAGNEPASVESVHLDARSHDVLLKLRRYAEGRKEAETALDWRVYTASMDLYTQFAVHEAVRGLLDHEWLRLARMAAKDH
ncbi:MAG: hypothetical protein H6810_01845 [Phycisphaeraceae bacterium]|nr:MAG: hypothetical protein H6810_01845 [Phycisphaeraceae bacterium]